MKTAERIADQCEVASRVVDHIAALWRAHTLPKLEEKVRRMSLQDQGFRFILRLKDGRVDGNWEHPADIKPGGYDATDLDDDELARFIQEGCLCPDCPATHADCNAVDHCLRWH